MHKKIATTIFIISALIAILINPTYAKEGATNGIKICEETIIPSLLAIMIITNLAIKTSFKRIIEKLFGGITQKLFKLPKCCAIVILLGLIGGYPVGAVLTNTLYESAVIDKATANRIMRFNFSGGLAFIITAIGTIYYNNSKLGLLLYLSTTIPSLIIGIISGLFIKEIPKSSYAFSDNLNFSDALSESVESASKSIITMCTYIIAFSSIVKIIPISDIFTPLLEITNIVKIENLPIEYCAMMLAFGGVCVHLQIIGIIKINYFDFLIFRTINAIMSFLIIRFIPYNQEVFSNISEQTSKLTRANIGFGMIMIIGCAVIILDIENRKIKLR